MEKDDPVLCLARHADAAVAAKGRAPEASKRVVMAPLLLFGAAGA